ncbi:MAG TPA: hypothetical protein ENK63_05090 [Rhodobacterales bacterium]|nr:hypothetical protein [Rhodobacterales bacterium]
MNMGTLAVLALAVILWFALSFVTKTWGRHAIAAGIAGLTTAYFRYPGMQEVAAQQGIAPMAPWRFALIAVAGMMLLAAAGMGLFHLMKQIRRGA